ncbi:MAG: WG repeat-containing protein, partial [Bacteroidales bacterium]|nr:WG repeat-containing protein [Bacteroidales bacterium]
TYNEEVINAFVVDHISVLSYTESERYENKDGEIVYLDKKVPTGLFSYRVGGRCGLMDANCKRLTDPLYESIIAVNKNMYRATLLDSYSEVILNAKGEIMQ